MKTQISDGSGRGFSATVDTNKRLHTDSVSRTQAQQSIEQGFGFNASTGAITLTSANPSSLFYVKNDSELFLIVKVIGLSIGASTGGTGNGIIELVANPTDGTIVSNSDALDVFANRNLGSSIPLTGEAYKGAEGYTFSGGTPLATTTRSAFPVVVNFEDEIFVLPRGTSLGVRYTPPAGNTSQSVVVFSTLFYETSEVDIATV